MPYILDPAETRSSVDFDRVNYDYEYPNGLKLKPGTKLHDKIKDEIMRRARDSAGIISGRFDDWKKIDETLTSYIRTDDAEKMIKEEDNRKPVSIVYPYSYAILETLLGYILAAFYQSPVFRYEGISPEDTIGAILLEKIIDVHSNKFKIFLNLHTMFRDSFAYGIGLGTPTWKQRYGKKIVKRVEKRLFSADLESKALEETLLFEGNSLVNIDPYQSLPDPNVSISDIQDGEYFGWIDRTNYVDLLSEEEHSNNIFNVKYLKHILGKRTSVNTHDQSGRNSKNKKTQPIDDASNPYDIIYMYIKIIPKDWNLGSGEYPEKWFFGIASDQIVVRAQPAGLSHDMFPIAAAAPDYDGYSTTPISRMEILYGMQHTLDWMFNAHVANVRKVINDTLIVDPYLINVNDFDNPRPGGIVRTRKPAWGRGVKDSVMQLGVTDITRGHIADASIIQSAMDKIGATDSSTMGSLRTSGPERLTGAEYKGTRQGGFSRLERIARVIGVQSMQDIGTMFAHNTQQFMSQEMYLKTTGRWQEQLVKEYGESSHVVASPFDILIDYDVKVRDGSVPGGNYSAVWEKMFELIASEPQLQQRFDIIRIFKHIARNNGAKNVDDFIKVQTASDEDVAGQAQAGNIVPINDILNGGGQ